MAEITDYLNGLGEQDIKESEILVFNNPNIEEIEELYKEWSEIREYWTDKRYNNALALLKKKTFTAKDIKDFSFTLKKYENQPDFHGIGIFLSALINTSVDGVFEIFTNHLNNTIEWFGGFNEGKNITVAGSTGSATGYEMKNGKLIISGSVGDSTGSHATGGEIYVSGKIGGIQKEVISRCKAKIYQKGVQIWPE